MKRLETRNTPCYGFRVLLITVVRQRNKLTNSGVPIPRIPPSDPINEYNSVVLLPLLLLLLVLGDDLWVGCLCCCCCGALNATVLLDATVVGVAGDETKAVAESSNVAIATTTIQIPNVVVVGRRLGCIVVLVNIIPFSSHVFHEQKNTHRTMVLLVRNVSRLVVLLDLDVCISLLCDTDPM